MTVVVCIDIAANKSNLAEALVKAFARRPGKIIFIGSDAVAEQKARDAGFVVEVLPVGAAVPSGALVVTPSLGTPQSRAFILAMKMTHAKK